VRRFFAPLPLLAAIACASEAKLTPIIGPDGTRMFHAQCRGDEGRCFEMAGQSCPQGYDLARTLGERDNFLVRCRQGGTAGWVPSVDLAPTPYGSPGTAARTYTTPVPVTTAPPGYPPLGPGRPPPNDVGY